MRNGEQNPGAIDAEPGKVRVPAKWRTHPWFIAQESLYLGFNKAEVEFITQQYQDKKNAPPPSIEWAGLHWISMPYCQRFSEAAIKRMVNQVTQGIRPVFPDHLKNYFLAYLQGEDLDAALHRDQTAADLETLAAEWRAERNGDDSRAQEAEQCPLRGPEDLPGGAYLIGALDCSDGTPRILVQRNDRDPLRGMLAETSLILNREEQRDDDVTFMFESGSHLDRLAKLVLDEAEPRFIRLAAAAEMFGVFAIARADLLGRHSPLLESSVLRAIASTPDPLARLRTTLLTTAGASDLGAEFRKTVFAFADDTFQRAEQLTSIRSLLDAASARTGMTISIDREGHVLLEGQPLSYTQGTRRARIGKSGREGTFLLALAGRGRIPLVSNTVVSRVRQAVSQATEGRIVLEKDDHGYHTTPPLKFRESMA